MLPQICVLILLGVVVSSSMFSQAKKSLTGIDLCDLFLRLQQNLHIAK